MFIYNKLLEKLNDAHINQYVLTHYYGLSRSVSTGIKKKQGLNMESLERLAMILGCKASDLYEFVDEDSEMENSVNRCRENVKEYYKPRRKFKEWELQSTEKPKKKKKTHSGKGKD